MRRALPVLLFLSLTGAATALALGGGPGSGERAALAASTSGSFVNSGNGLPIFAATGLAPGDSTRGTVEISYDGEAPGALTLEQDDVVDQPGPGGGELSRRLSVRIADVTLPAEPATVYEGALAPMPPQQAGRLVPGETRTYEFVATLPAGPPETATQNDVQGASASVGYSWTVHESPEADPAPIPPSGAAATPLAPPASSAPAPGALRLSIVRVARRVRHGRLMVWARCDRSCRISVRGRLRVRGGGVAGRARLRTASRPRLKSGTQRVTIRVPGRSRRLLATSPSRAKARIVLRARATDGQADVARRWVRLRNHRRR